MVNTVRYMYSYVDWLDQYVRFSTPRSTTHNTVNHTHHSNHAHREV